MAGENVGGCDLVLNCGQMDSPYIPNLHADIWTFNHTNEFKSITLTHTGGTATCTDPAKCETCGESYGDPAAHTIENHVCTACGAMEVVWKITGDYDWKDGDTINITVHERNYLSHELTADVADDGTVIWIPDKPICWGDGSDYEIYAACPYVADPTYFVLPDDQSSLDKFRAADWMTFYWSGTPTTDVIEVELTPRLSKVTVNYEVVEGVAAEFSNIEVYSNAGAMRFVEGVVYTSVGQFDVWVTPYLDGNQFTAFVSPDAYAVDGNFIKITLDNGTVYEVKMNKAVTFKEGVEYTYMVNHQKHTGTLIATQEVTESGETRAKVRISNVPVAYWDYRYEIKVTHTATGESITVTGSVLDWAKRCIKYSQNDAEKDMAMAMFFYNAAANDYFGK